MTVDRTVAEWDRTFARGRIRNGPSVWPEHLADRFGVDDPDVMWELANEATRAMIDDRECALAIEHFDTAASSLGVSVDG